MEELNDAYAAVEESVDDSGVALVRISGEVDISNVATIEARLVAITSRLDSAPAVDLSQLTFMDSSGIAMLLRVAERIGPLTIKDPSQIARQIITATGLGEVLRMDGAAPTA